MEDLLSVFFSLPSAQVDRTGRETFVAHSIAGRDQWRVTKGASGQPAVLIAVAPSRSGGRQAPVELENLRVEHDVRCSVSDEYGERRLSRFSIIRCLSDDSEVQASFWRTIGGALIGMDRVVGASDLAELVDRLIRLFRLARKPRVRTIRGLWAELFSIMSARDPGMMIEAWHNDAMERFDFSLGYERLEVKSSSTRSREHIFGLEQVHPPSGERVLVASVYVEERASGTSLGSLWDRAADTVSNAVARLKVERICAQTLGRDIGLGRAFCADWAAAADSMTFYDVSDIPRPPSGLPPGVSDVRFRSDLRFADPVASTGLGIFHQCCLGY